MGDESESSDCGIYFTPLLPVSYYTIKRTFLVYQDAAGVILALRPPW